MQIVDLISTAADAGLGLTAIYLFARLRDSLDGLQKTITGLGDATQNLDQRVTALESQNRQKAA
jgi:cell division protein FtsB